MNCRRITNTVPEGAKPRTKGLPENTQQRKDNNQEQKAKTDRDEGQLYPIFRVACVLVACFLIICCMAHICPCHAVCFR